MPSFQLCRITLNFFHQNFSTELHRKEDAKLLTAAVLCNELYINKISLLVTNWQCRKLAGEKLLHHKVRGSDYVSFLFECILYFFIHVFIFFMLVFFFLTRYFSIAKKPRINLPEKRSRNIYRPFDLAPYCNCEHNLTEERQEVHGYCGTSEI